jgi:hypothetical protein
MRRGAVEIAFAIAATAVAPASAADGDDTPNDVAARVHAEGGYPSELRIGEAPRWTLAPGPTIFRVHPERLRAMPGRGFGGGSGFASGDDATGDSSSGVAPQEGGGRLGEESDGWEGDPWAVPEAAQTPAVIDVYQLEPGATPGEMGMPLQPSDEPCDGGQCPRPGASASGGGGSMIVLGADGEPIDDRDALADALGEATLSAGGDALGDVSAAGATVGDEGETGGAASGDAGDTDGAFGPTEPVPEAEDGGSAADGDTGSAAELGPLAESSSSGADADAESSSSESSSSESSSSDDGGSESDTGDETTGGEETAEEDDDDDAIALWLALLAALGLGGWIARRLRRRFLAARAAKTGTPTRPFAASPVVAGAIPQIDYDAEIRALLQAGLMAVGWQPRGRELSLTAREIARGVNDPRTPPLGELVRVAEIVRFAGIAADATLYERARAAYLAMRAATRGQGDST